MSDRHERGDKPSRKDVRRMMDTVRGVRPNTPDQIIICGVTITRQQWETMDLLWKHVNKFGTWEAFVAANTKPEHWDGEPCELPVFDLDIDRAEGFRFEYTGKVVDKGSLTCWYHSIESGGVIIWWNPPGPRWELRAVRVEPEHKVGDRFVYTEDHPHVLSSYGLPNPCEFEFVRLSDTKRAGEAIYRSATCPVDFSWFRSEYKFTEPRWILRPIINPEHVKGDMCTARIASDMVELAEGLQFIYNEKGTARVGKDWYENTSNDGDRIIVFARYREMCDVWVLTAVPRKPAPKYDVGKWVVTLDGKPRKITEVRGSVYCCDDGWHDQSLLRPAVREDFMRVFKGVKVWMEEDHTGTWECNDSTTKHKSLSPWEVERNLVAGVIPMPEEFWG